MALGSYPSHRYSRSWITQRLFNQIPEWAAARKYVTDLGQQFMNPIALDIQDTYQQLARARYDQFISTADIAQLDSLYRLDILPEMEFQYTESANGERQYIPPTVFATINGTEYQITQAENNDIKTLAYDNLPSRIEDGETTYSYQAVIPETTVAGLASISPNTIYIYGHLYITLKDNTSWEQRSNTKIYYPKIYITGTTRKGTELTEAVPLRYNGTFKTINEWKEVDSIFVSYLDSTATITLEVFPFGREGYMDDQNVYVPAVGGERMQFTRLGTQTYGSTFIAESYSLANMDIVRKGIEDKDINYEIELLDQSSNNVTLVDFVHRPNSRFIYAIDEDTFYIYDINLPYPDLSNLEKESEGAKIDLDSDQWIIARNNTATIYTHNLDDSDPPWRVRWHVIDPSGIEYYMGLDGSLWPTTTEAWLDNELWSSKRWREQEIDLVLSQTGSYIISLEAQYYNDITNTTKTLTTRALFQVPVIIPEVQFSLPVGLSNSTNIAIDSDNKIWLIRYDGAHLLDIYFDYFLVDYERKRVYMKEQYTSARIVI